MSYPIMEYHKILLKTRRKVIDIYFYIIKETFLSNIMHTSTHTCTHTQRQRKYTTKYWWKTLMKVISGWGKLEVVSLAYL